MTSSCKTHHSLSSTRKDFKSPLICVIYIVTSCQFYVWIWSMLVYSIRPMALSSIDLDSLKKLYVSSWQEVNRVLLCTTLTAICVKKEGRIFLKYWSSVRALMIGTTRWRYHWHLDYGRVSLHFTRRYHFNRFSPGQGCDNVKREDNHITEALE